MEDSGMLLGCKAGLICIYIYMYIYNICINIYIHNVYIMSLSIGFVIRDKQTDDNWDTIGKWKHIQQNEWEHQHRLPKQYFC